MQNKPNFLDAQMNVSSIVTKYYENKPRLRAPGKQTQSKPIPLPPKLKRLQVLMNHGGKGNNTPKESLPQSYKISSPQKRSFLRKRENADLQLYLIFLLMVFSIHSLCSLCELLQVLDEPANNRVPTSQPR